MATRRRGNAPKRKKENGRKPGTPPKADAHPEQRKQKKQKKKRKKKKKKKKKKKRAYE